MANSELKTDGMLLKVRDADEKGFAAAMGLKNVEPLMEVPAQEGDGKSLAPSDAAVWVRMDTDEDVWDRAHQMMASGFSAAGGPVEMIEPNIVSQWDTDRALMAASDGPLVCSSEPQSEDIGAVGTKAGWHLGDDFSQLAKARGNVSAAKQKAVRVAHLDTGYDPDHDTCPKNILTDLQRNFTGEGSPSDARDTTPPDRRFESRGHGPATIGILAGAEMSRPLQGFSGPIGGAPDVSIIPVRVANHVVQLSTSGVVQGFDYALKSNADLISMSLGGVSSSALADAVNKCYDAGVAMVCAAGNNIYPAPPESIVYPARMRRVIAATGVMANGKAYAEWAKRTGKMRGNYGPSSKMKTAIAAFTPNVFWPVVGCPKDVGQDGNGTSSTTAQVAAAVALWIAKYKHDLDQYDQPWKKGEAVRQALFSSGRNGGLPISAKQVEKLLGMGVLSADQMLQIEPLAARKLKRQPRASTSWSWLKLLTGRGTGFADTVMKPREEMLALEIMQIAMSDGELEKIMPDPEDPEIGEKEQKQFLEAVRDSGKTSNALKVGINRVLDDKQPLQRVIKSYPDYTKKLEQNRPLSSHRAPTHRKLKVFALDPSLAGDLETYDNAVATVDVPYETDAKGNSILKPGPVGEYLEIVDIDPASNKFYPPVDLDDPNILIQDGVNPSEGDPAFHQQMVYAVGMRTIKSFEEALGRPAIWAIGKPKSKDKDGKAVERYEYTPRLRIYPHALREKNAYYSPARMALLFGYFPAESERGSTTPDGCLVFSCLSADIVAHEMTHALLDGYTQGYRESSNPDVAAFHEGFSDIVALFQHFQYRDLVRSQIAETRGDVSAASLLGGMARQFGEATGKKGPLRDYVDPDGNFEYDTTVSHHKRGSLLVAAIYKSYLTIFEKRTKDLIRLATGGRGILAPGEIPPVLVDRLTDEACSIADGVLKACIRALDYCPPFDISFSAYLRALITADTDHAPDNPDSYRVAFLDGFRAFGMLPSNLRTMSVETLKWSAPTDSKPDWLKEVVEAMDIDWSRNLDRWETFQRTRKWCRKVHKILTKVAKDPTDCKNLALEHNLPKFDDEGLIEERPEGTCFKVRDARIATRRRADSSICNEIILVLEQRRPEPKDPDNPGMGHFWFHGGATIVIDSNNAMNEPEISYFVWKWLGSNNRLKRERAFRVNPSSGLRSMYFSGAEISDDGLNFDDGDFSNEEPFAMLHSEDYE